MAFKVTEILSANTIRVTPRWSWENNKYSGDQITIKNFSVTNGQLSDFIKTKLSNLLMNRDVELKNPTSPKMNNGNDEITVSVYLNGVDISIYFPELKS